jgi:hypothetical protein
MLLFRLCFVSHISANYVTSLIFCAFSHILCVFAPFYAPLALLYAVSKRPKGRVSLCSLSRYTHAHTYIHAQTCTHMQTQEHTTHTCTHTHTHTHTYAEPNPHHQPSTHTHASAQVGSPKDAHNPDVEFVDFLFTPVVPCNCGETCSDSRHGQQEGERSRGLIYELGMARGEVPAPILYLLSSLLNLPSFFFFLSQSLSHTCFALTPALCLVSS